MRRDFRLYLDDILEAIHQIRTYLADQNEEAFTKDRKTQDAVIRNLEIIGEAAGNSLSKTSGESRRTAWPGDSIAWPIPRFLGKSSNTSPHIG
jgi:uncharacterized protein with HEPN domain